MIKREAKFTILFRHWILANPPLFSHAYELKQTQKEYINFNEIKEHQINALMTVAHGEKGILWKLPDDSRGIKPFDMFYLRDEKAYIVIKYPKFFCIIEIDDFIKEKAMGAKSLTSDRAKVIAVTVVDLK